MPIYYNVLELKLYYKFETHLWVGLSEAENFSKTSTSELLIILRGCSVFYCNGLYHVHIFRQRSESSEIARKT